MIQISKKLALLIIAPCLLVPFIIITQKAELEKKQDTVLLAKNNEPVSEESVPLVRSENTPSASKQKSKSAQSKKKTEQPRRLVTSERESKEESRAQSNRTVEQPRRLVTSDVPAAKEEVKAADAAIKKLTISQDWDKKTLGYKHWTGWYYPSKWILTINGKEVLTFEGKVYDQRTKHITVDASKQLKARFDWEFLGGRRKGWKEIDYKINENADKLELSFNWKNEPWQLTISNTKPISTRSSDNKTE